MVKRRSSATDRMLPSPVVTLCGSPRRIGLGAALSSLADLRSVIDDFAFVPEPDLAWTFRAPQEATMISPALLSTCLSAGSKCAKG